MEVTKFFLLLSAVETVLSEPSSIEMLSISPIDPAISTLMEVIKNIPSSKPLTTQRGKRSAPLQRLSSDQFIQCQNVAWEQGCTPGGLQEQLYSLAGECGQNQLASLAHIYCGVNDNGLYCGQALDLAELYGSEATSCFSSTSCSSTCRRGINSINQQLGCCSGHLNQALSGEQSILSGSLWSSCGVSPGPLCSIPTFSSSISNSRICTLKETNRMVITHRCTQENSGPVIEALANTTGCSTVAKAHVERCEVDSNGNLCRLNTGLNTAIRMIRNCASSRFSSTCSSSCRSSMIALRNELGCCLNTHYNGTLARVSPVSEFIQILPFFTNSFWSRCGVTTPGTCQSLLTLPTSSTENQLPDNQPTDNTSDNGSIKFGGMAGLVILLVLSTQFI